MRELGQGRRDPRPSGEDNKTEKSKRPSKNSRSPGDKNQETNGERTEYNVTVWDTRGTA